MSEQNFTTVSNDEPEVKSSAVAKAEQKEDQQSVKDDAAQVEESGEELADESEAKEDQPKKKKGGFQKKLERQQKEIEELRAKLQSSQRVEQPQKKESAKDDGRPKVDDFDDQVSFMEALTDWKIEQREKLKQEESKKLSEKSEFEKNLGDFQSKAKEFSKSIEDYEDVISDVDDVSLSKSLQGLLLDSDVGPQLLYELAKNRDEFVRINSMQSESAQARAIGRLEATLTKQTKTKAPPPLKSINGSSAGSTKDPADMTLDEYRVWRAKNFKRN